MLERIALISTLIGIMLLIAISSQIEPKPIEISQIDAKMLEEWVKITGSVGRIKDGGGMLIIGLNSDEGNHSIDVIAYKNKAYIGEIEDGMNIEVIGKVTEYYNKLEIEASKINKYN